MSGGTGNGTTTPAGDNVLAMVWSVVMFLRTGLKKPSSIPGAQIGICPKICCSKVKTYQ